MREFIKQQVLLLCDTCEITKLQSKLAESESLRSVQWPPYSEWPVEIHALIAVARMVKDIRLNHQLKRIDELKKRVMTGEK